jgi:ElaA protein
MIEIKHFSDCSIYEVYGILQLRSEVFVVEQNCVYQDLDSKDLDAFHVIIKSASGDIVATARVLKAGVSYPEVSIGRVCTSKAIRQQGLGKELMESAVAFIENQWSSVECVISAQLYLQKFYESLQFVAEGEVYLEDNIPHIQMRRK